MRALTPSFVSGGDDYLFLLVDGSCKVRVTSSPVAALAAAAAAIVALVPLLAAVSACTCSVLSPLTPPPARSQFESAEAFREERARWFREHGDTV